MIICQCICKCSVSVYHYDEINKAKIVDLPVLELPLELDSFLDVLNFLSHNVFSLLTKALIPP